MISAQGTIWIPFLSDSFFYTTMWSNINKILHPTRVTPKVNCVRYLFKHFYNLNVISKVAIARGDFGVYSTQVPTK